MKTYLDELDMSVDVKPEAVDNDTWFGALTTIGCAILRAPAFCLGLYASGNEGG